MNFNNIFEEFQREQNEIEKFGRNLDADGEVREVKLRNTSKMLAARLIKKERDFRNETMIKTEVYGLIKTNKIISKKINDEDYNLIIMEKSLYKDLEKLNKYYHKQKNNEDPHKYHLLRDLDKYDGYNHEYNIFKLIKEDIFDGKIGDNLLRFYANHILNSLVISNRNYLLHFDVKPKNLIITINLIIKFFDFSLVTKIKDDDIIKIPGDTQGYLTSDYYNEKKASNSVVRKQDYFDLGSTLFYLKYGENLDNNDDSSIIAEDKKISDLQQEKARLNNKIKEDSKERDSIDMGHASELLLKINDVLKARHPTTPKFIDFLFSLIQYDANNKENSDKIYRNKWLNENKEVIENIVHSNEKDEEKIIIELQKGDHLINKDNKLNPKYEIKKKKKFNYKKKKKIII